MEVIHEAKRSRPTLIIVYAYPALSLIWFILFTSLCIRARMILGHWPSSHLDEEIGTHPFHVELCVDSFSLLIWLFLPWLASIGILVFWQRLCPRRDLLISLCLLIPALLFIFTDPAEMFTWFLD